MKNIYHAAYLILPIVIFSCKKDFLDVKVTNILNKQAYVKDLSSLNQYMNGIYVSLNTHFEAGFGAVYSELVSDNILPTAIVNQPYLFHYTWSQIAEDKREYSGDFASNSKAMNGLWKSYYYLIRQCNFVIETAPTIRRNNETKVDFIHGQALALRSLLHFQLLNVFAQPFNYSADASHPGIPYITTSDVTVPFSRQSVMTVYNSLIEDLNTAIKLLSQSTADSRYMNKAAAEALLSRIYLFKEDYPNAITHALEVINRTPLLTIAQGYPDGLFKFNPNEPSETLFQLTPITDLTTGLVNLFMGWSLEKSFKATNDIANIITETPEDVRAKWVINQSGSWNIKKFPQGVSGIHIIPSSDYYPAIIRASETYLTLAEAAAKTGDEKNG
ncbi:MAG: RagB/SusD family nutrient uptake outer membrane protein [Candidatus Pseudobacter hemicellulosilyticus]|uniref:RagB/SusD family nutrient uptake outer membrane protein n=1 Tax=Candidatus Pseudobacter hemicellulosilyticus TaxID=3121375 RepID=A0AAJ5WTN7_9BACT|nr:MAG: RagB/SusD family nutrient uptake outer membrane protein [Pseudobacter sp.]